MNNYQTLEQASVLFTLVDPQLRQLARRLRPIELRAGTRVVQENQAGDSLYLIERGSCRVAIETRPDNLVTVAELTEGDIFGETTLIDEPSAVSVITLADCRLLAVDRASLHAVVPTNDPAAAELRPLILRRQESYREMAARAARVTRAGDAVITAVYAPKGGSGRTTIALNFAAQLAKGNSGSVLLIDLDLPYSQAALLSGLIPNGSLTTASWGASLGTDADLEDALIGAAQLHPSGFMVLPAAVKLEESELVPPHRRRPRHRSQRDGARRLRPGELHGRDHHARAAQLEGRPGRAAHRPRPHALPGRQGEAGPQPAAGDRRAAA
jgi:CRP-like cAMP-binding protein